MLEPFNKTFRLNLSTKQNQLDLLQKISNDNQIQEIASMSFSPSVFECVLIFVTSTLFIVGIVGNLLVILVVLKNSHMRTITNMFIFNLAIGDFFVILICLPPTILNDVTGNWWFGETMCKIIPYVQVITV